MNFVKKGILLITLLTLIGSIAKAQDNSFSNTAILGIGTPILDNGIGFHIGYNPSLSVHEYVAVEGQLSYFYAKVTGSFLSGDTGMVHSVNTLVGPRIYFTPQDAKVRPYISALAGGLYNNEIIDRIDSAPEFGLGFSGGAFVKVNQLTFGLSYDTPGNVILKAGYTF